MIPVALAPEPAVFDRLVRVRGYAFLARVPTPSSKEFNRHAYWREILKELHRAYRGVCAYSCHWIPADTGGDTVEHFLPKSLVPTLAYEWSNYRLVCARLNGRKGNREGVLDPFVIGPDWFRIEFPSLLVKPGETLSDLEFGAVSTTIEVLGLNDESSCLENRVHYTRNFCRGRIDWLYMVNHAPFLASEIDRQGLKQSLSEIMRFDDAVDSEWSD